MKKFLIAEAEKARILGMHYNAMGKSLINEGSDDPGSITASPRPQAYVDKGMSYIGFTYYGENGVRKEYYYNCVTNVEAKSSEINQPGVRAGDIMDGNNNVLTPQQIGLKGDYMTELKGACKNIYAYYNNYKKTFCADPKNKTKDNYKWLCPQEAPQAQVAAATTTTVNAPNPVSDADAAARQKSQAETKAKKEQATIDLKTLMDSPSGFLRTTDNDGNLITDKTTLDAQVKELDRVLTAGGIPTGAGQPVQDLLRSMTNLVKRFPEYSEVLKSHIYNLKQ